MKCKTMQSPIGLLLLQADNEHLCGVSMAGEALPAEESCAVLCETEWQLGEYFAGKRQSFDLPLLLNGTPFEQAVWMKLKDIPYGSAVSYAEIARRIGRPGAERAVGRACSRNPVLVVVPCHRVVSSSGRLTGFAAGMPAKRTLLEGEGIAVRDDRIAADRHRT